MGVCDAYKDRFADLAGCQAHLANSPRRRWRHADSRVGELQSQQAKQLPHVLLAHRDSYAIKFPSRSRPAQRSSPMSGTEVSNMNPPINRENLRDFLIALAFAIG